MLDKVVASDPNKARFQDMNGWFIVEDDLLNARDIRFGDTLLFQEHVGDLVPGRIYIVCEHENAQAVARVYSASGRFVTASTDPDLTTGFEVGSGTTIEGVVGGFRREVW